MKPNNKKWKVAGKRRRRERERERVVNVSLYIPPFSILCLVVLFLSLCLRLDIAPFFFFLLFFPLPPLPTSSWPGRDGHKRALDAEQWCCPHALSATSADSPRSSTLVSNSSTDIRRKKKGGRRKEQQAHFPSRPVIVFSLSARLGRLSSAPPCCLCVCCQFIFWLVGHNPKTNHIWNTFSWHGHGNLKRIDLSHQRV